MRASAAYLPSCYSPSLLPLFTLCTWVGSGWLGVVGFGLLLFLTHAAYPDAATHKTPHTTCAPYILRTAAALVLVARRTGRHISTFPRTYYTFYLCLPFPFYLHFAASRFSICIPPAPPSSPATACLCSPFCACAHVFIHKHTHFPSCLPGKT